MFTWHITNSRKLLFFRVWQYLTSSVFGQTYKKHQRLQSECCCFWRIREVPLLVPLLHFLTLVFSSSPFFRLPQSPEFAAGQKAAAEAQPIWNAAPPSWRSEREEGTRLVVNQTTKSTSCLYPQPTYSACLDLLDYNWQHAPYTGLMSELWNMHEKVN